jgi:hypothetical protein
MTLAVAEVKPKVPFPAGKGNLHTKQRFVRALESGALMGIGIERRPSRDGLVYLIRKSKIFINDIKLALTPEEIVLAQSGSLPYVTLRGTLLGYCFHSMPDCSRFSTNRFESFYEDLDGRASRAALRSAKDQTFTALWELAHNIRVNPEGYSVQFGETRTMNANPGICDFLRRG